MADHKYDSGLSEALARSDSSLLAKVQFQKNNKLTDIKAYQDLASKIWAAVIIILGIISVNKYKLKIS